MFCTNCSAKIDAQSVFCTNCGFETGKGANYCFSCGEPVSINQYGCTNCGAVLSKVPRPNSGKATNGQTIPEDMKILCGFMALLFGYIGVHNFILGETRRGIVKIVLLVFCWLIIPLIVETIMVLSDMIKMFSGSYVVKK